MAELDGLEHLAAFDQIRVRFEDRVELFLGRHLDPVVGSEILKTRPAVIVSNDSCNRYGVRVVVLPITSNVESLYPGEARVEVKGKPGRALGDQIPVDRQDSVEGPRRASDGGTDVADR